ncbi:hypothetical protein [Sphingobacterium faecium]|uniref:hypothetical protein n=1 Tax=Sphingobacterium faecium TaxID=34087 RepID=UPI0024696284|nr:hypothetical protein [Sphingobacterium faecium]MDH5826220.1 hypothetical protein [Sphingobacterium faecium]
MKKQNVTAKMSENDLERLKNRNRQSQYAITAYSMSPVMAGINGIFLITRPNIIVVMVRAR